MAVVTGSVIAGLAIAGAEVGTAAIQAHAAGEAAQQQKTASDQALEYAKQQDKYKYATEANRYAAMTSSMKPYISAGASAEGRMAQLLGLPSPQQGPSVPDSPMYPTPPLPGTPSTAVPRGSTTPWTPSELSRGISTPLPPQGSTPPSGRTVLMRSPDGATQQVPQEQVQHYQSRGATVVQSNG